MWREEEEEVDEDNGEGVRGVEGEDEHNGEV